MQAIVKTRNVKLVAEGHLSVFFIEALKKEFGRNLVLRKESSKKESYNIDPVLAKTLKKLKSPGERLRFCRVSYNMTQVAIAETLKISFSFVSAWERGIRRIRKDNAEALAEMFHVPVNTFTN